MFDKAIGSRLIHGIFFTFFLAIAFIPLSATAEIAARPGWVVVPTGYDYPTLADRVLAAAKQNKIGVVSQASATVGAKAVLDKTIPGNTVIGLYHPRFAVPMLEASIAAGIEAPIRVYVTENPDGSATLSYKMPSAVFAPYMDEGGEALAMLAAELDALFATLSADATAQ